MDGGYAYGRQKCVWHEMSCKSFWQHFKKHKNRRRVTRRAAARDAVWLPKVSRGWRRGGWWETAVISTLTSVFWEHLSFPSVESSLASFRGMGRGGAGRSGTGRILLPPAVNIYACVLFIYIVKTNFAQGFNCFSLLCHAHSLPNSLPPSLPTSLCNPLQLRPCAATVSDTHAKHGRKCCLFSIKNLSSTIARSKLIPGPFIGSRQVLNRQIP